MTTLRGAQVDVDVRRVGRVVVVACLVGLAALSATFYVVGANKNAQIDALKNHGAPIEITITRCLGLLAGSGSNAGGYACTGSFTLDGRRYVESVPGNSYFEPGAKVAGVAATTMPGLFTTVRELRGDDASAGVYIVPTVLLVALIVLLGVAARSRAQRRASVT